ncbi:MAG TPA: PA2779 family protein [Burkholderiales bacterium]|nr:PA2779 family protein [Burkholderiales bacterium]
MTFIRRFVSITLIISLAGMGLPLPAQAGMLPTDSVITSGAKERVVSLLERSDVRAQLESLGVNPADAKARVASLTDVEAAQLAAKIDQLPAGGDGVGALVGALVLIFIVLLITDILGLTHIFPFTRSIR